MQKAKRFFMARLVRPAPHLLPDEGILWLDDAGSWIVMTPVDTPMPPPLGDRRHTVCGDKLAEDDLSDDDLIPVP